MDFGDDSNPFADTTARQPAVSSFPNRRDNDNNPFASTNTPVQPVPPTPAAYLPSEQPPPNRTPAYTPVPTPPPVQQSAAIPVDTPDLNKRQSELEAREKRLAERERALTAETSGVSLGRVNNFPPFPKFCPCRPCFFHDISLDIPDKFQRWVRIVFYLWLIYCLTLLFNTFAATVCLFLGVTGSITTFILAIIYFFLFIPLSYMFWFRSIYRAFKVDSSVFFMVFFVIDIMFIITSILFATGFPPGMCGFFRVDLTSSSTNTFLKFLMVTLGGLWTLISIASVILTIKIHRLYRTTGASLEQAQKELKTDFMNNSTVRGAAREVATAGINSAISTDESQRIIY